MAGRPPVDHVILDSAESIGNGKLKKEPPGDILVFLTGQDDIDAAVELLTEEAQNNGKSSPGLTITGLTILPLYSGLSRADQDLVFSPTPRGKRKVVISINIAETSLTLEIIDVENLIVAPISKASTRQRAGRAGRVRPGKCYRLYTEEYYVNEMSTKGIPEIQRTSLVSSVIQHVIGGKAFTWIAEVAK